MKRRGFTIIEVVLVLAIAGLIFLMVFVALPALQRSQRNTQRRRDAARVSTAIQEYIKRNNKLPFGDTRDSFDTNFVTRYIDSNCVFDNNTTGSSANIKNYNYKNCGTEFTSPDGTYYVIGLFGGNKSTFRGWNAVDYHRIYLMSGARCGELENQVEATGNGKDYIVAIKLEGASVYCIDNS